MDELTEYIEGTREICRKQWSCDGCPGKGEGESGCIFAPYNKTDISPQELYEIVICWKHKHNSTARGRDTHA